MEKQQNWYFTFGCGQPNAEHFIRFFGTKEETRERMFQSFGKMWSMQYSEEEWNNPSKDSKEFNGFKPSDKVTLAQVWNWKEIY